MVPLADADHAAEPRRPGEVPIRRRGRDEPGVAVGRERDIACSDLWGAKSNSSRHW